MQPSAAAWRSHIPGTDGLALYQIAEGFVHSSDEGNHSAGWNGRLADWDDKPFVGQEKQFAVVDSHLTDPAIPEGCLETLIGHETRQDTAAADPAGLVEIESCQGKTAAGAGELRFEGMIAEGSHLVILAQSLRRAAVPVAVAVAGTAATAMLVPLCTGSKISCSSSAELEPAFQ